VLWIGSETGRALQSSIKKRFVRWITDTVTRPFDQDWLDYQYEIGLRHSPEKKNATDQAQRPSVVSLRLLLAFIKRAFWLYWRRPDWLRLSIRRRMGDRHPQYV